MEDISSSHNHEKRSLDIARALRDDASIKEIKDYVYSHYIASLAIGISFLLPSSHIGDYYDPLNYLVKEFPRRCDHYKSRFYIDKYKKAHPSDKPTTVIEN